MPTPINKRPYRTFLSHAHVDKDFVNGLHDWLVDFAAMKVWYDSVKFPSGFVASELGKAIEECQSALLVVSEASVKSGWVDEEWNICVAEQKSFPDFQIILLKLDNHEAPPSMRARKWIEVANKEMTADIGCQIIEAMHWHQTRPSEIQRSAFYLSRGSRPAEVENSERWLARCRSSGCRFVRDSPDQYSFSEERIKNIMVGTSGLFAFVPNRGGSTSKYILDEVRFAREINVNVVAILESGLTKDFVATLVGDANAIVDAGEESAGAIENLIQNFLDDARPPLRAAHCFVGHGLDPDNKAMWSAAKRVIEVVSGLPCLSGDSLVGSDLQRQIVQKISTSAIAIFDISGDLLNTSIEAGIARGAGVPYELVCKGPRRSPPFIFRDKQVFFYETAIELVGVVRKLVLDLRRVIN